MEKIEGGLKLLSTFAFALALTLAVAAPAQGPAYPAKPIRLVVPFPPGAGTDTVARYVAQKLGESMKATIVIDNRTGAGGAIGAVEVAKAEPDGYTLLFVAGPFTTVAAASKNASYDPVNQFSAVAPIATSPLVFVVNPTVRANSMREFIALAKREPGKLNIGTSAIGTGGYLSAELFKSMAGLEVTIVPYKGTGQVMNDLLGGHVPVAFGVLPPALGNLQAGTLRAIAMISPTRFSMLPDVPTANESGLPGFESVLHYGLLAPTGTPRPIIDRLNKELRAVVNTEQLKQRIQAEGGDPLTSSPEEYAKDIDSEETKWGTLVRKLNLKVE